MTTTTKELVEQYKEAEKLAALDLNEVPTKSRHGWEMRKNAAKEEVKALRAAYEEELKQALVFIIPVGPGAKTFVEVAAAETGAISVDVDDMYNRVVDFIEPTMNAKRAFGMSQLFQMAQELRSVAIELGQPNISTPELPESIECPDRAATLRAVKLVATRAGSSALQAHYLAKQVVNLALEAEFTSSVVPVLLTNVAGKEEAEALGKNLLVGRHVVADAPENTDTNSVLETLKTIKKNLKTTNNQ